MLSLTSGNAYISFAMGWEVSLVVRNTIAHGGSQIRLHKRPRLTNSQWE